MTFVPDGFEPPTGLDHEHFGLRPLGPEHNESDYAAWTSSVEHILATPGYEGAKWPHPMTPDENKADLTEHAREFAAREGFTYTVLAPDSETVIGCLYIYPSERPEFDAKVRSWVRAADAELDPVLYRAVTDWLPRRGRSRIDYAERPRRDRTSPGGEVAPTRPSAIRPRSVPVGHRVRSPRRRSDRRSRTRRRRSAGSPPSDSQGCHETPSQ